MSVPYSRDYQDLVVEDDEETFELGMPHRGTITRFVVTQDGDDAADGFAVDLFNKEAISPPGSSSSEAGTGNEELFKIFATKTAAASARTLSEFGVNHPYTNKDGTPTNPVRKLYLRIRPVSGGPKSFSCAVTVTPPAV